MPEHSCRQCGGDPGVFVSTGRPKKFCSKACYAEWSNARQRPRRGNCTVCDDSPTIALGLCVKHYSQSRRKRASCIVCNEVVPYGRRGSSAKFCSVQCMAKHWEIHHSCKSCGKVLSERKAVRCRSCSKRELAAIRPKKRKPSSEYSHRRRQRMGYTKISWRDISVKFGWSCHWCGVETPESLRGSYADNSPEMDHAIPLAKGGTHTVENMVNSCRRCNLLKSDLLPHEFLMKRRNHEKNQGRFA